MESFEDNQNTQQGTEQQHSETEFTHHTPSEQSLLEEAGNLSPLREKPHQDLLTDEGGDFLVHQEQEPSGNSDFPDFGDHFGAQQHEDLLKLESDSPTKEIEEHKSDEPQHGFDFEKELPTIPHESGENASGMQMNFSNTHFQAEDHQPFDDSPTEELMKEHEDHHPSEEYLKMQEESQPAHEVDFEQDVHEPVLNASTQKVEESQSIPWKAEESQPSHEKAEESYPSHEKEEEQEENKFSHESLLENVYPPVPTEVEEIVPPSPPVGHHRPAPPIPTEEEELKVSPVIPAKATSVSPPSKDRPAEPLPSAEGSTKTRSVRSTKTPDATSSRGLLGGWLNLGRLNAIVTDLIYWRDPRKSGIVLGATLAILLSLSVVSVVSVISYSALAVLTVTLSFRLYKNVLQAVQKTQDGHPFKEYLETDVTIPTEKVHEVAELSAARLNASLLELRRLFLVDDLVDSIKFALLLWCLTYVGSWFNGLTLVILGVVGLFSLPKVYETHQDKIDQNVDIVRGKVNEIIEKVQAVVPIGKKPKSQ